MDYTAGAIDLRRQAIVSCCLDKLGSHVAGPTGAWFDRAHLIELAQDQRFYGLARKSVREFVRQIVKARPWVKRVKDCENRANKALGDLTDAAEKYEWSANAAIGVICYDSKSLAKSEEIWSGYHAALLVIEWDENGGILSVWIVEPKVLHEDGSETPEKWMDPSEEILRWVWFTFR